MAKAEPSENHDSAIQESSPKPFKDVKDFKKVANSQDFYAFFESKFQLIESQVENHQPYELFKVAEKETLTVFTTNVSDPYKLDVGTYNVILYETKQSKLRIRVFGALASFQDVEKSYIDRTLSNGKFSNEMNQLKYCDSDVNYTLFLLGKTKEEKFVKGKLESWTRDEKGRIIARSNLADLLKRRKIWESKHPKPKEIQYDLEECRMARCFHLIKGSCEYQMKPTNDKKGNRLPKAKGYCFDYVSKYQIKFEKKGLSIFQKEKENLNDSFKKEFTKLKKVKATKIDQNIATPEFDRKRFTVLLFLQLEIFSDNFKNLIPNSENFLSDLEEKWLDLLEFFKDFCNRVFNGRGYVTAEKSFISLQSEIASDYAYRTERLEQARKSIVHYNQLVKELFNGKEGEMGVDFNQLQRGTHLYFVTSKGKSNFSFRKSSDYFNVGRSKKEDNKWEDIHLSSVDSYQTYDFSTTQEALENPIYKVKEVKPNEVVLIDTATKETVKILSSRKYSPQIIYFNHQYRPQVKAYKKTDLKEFF
jgi:hypothetical protein